MDLLRTNAKAIAAAVTLLLITVLRHTFPDVAQTDVQEAIRVLIEIAVTAAAVWAVPNKDTTT